MSPFSQVEPILSPLPNNGDSSEANWRRHGTLWNIPISHPRPVRQMLFIPIRSAVNKLSCQVNWSGHAPLSLHWQTDWYVIVGGGRGHEPGPAAQRYIINISQLWASRAASLRVKLVLSWKLSVWMNRLQAGLVGSSLRLPRFVGLGQERPAGSNFMLSVSLTDKRQTVAGLLRHVLSSFVDSGHVMRNWTIISAEESW